MAPPLPRAHFLGVPLEIRVKIYEHFFALLGSYWIYFSDEEMDRWARKIFPTYPGSHLFALLYTNQQINMEAIAVFFRIITLHVSPEFVPGNPSSLVAFTDRIGCHNAALLCRVDISFPATVKRPDGDLELEAPSVQTLCHLKARCPGLTRLRFWNCIYSRKVFDQYQRNPSSVSAVLAEINGLVRGIAPLRNIIVYTGENVVLSPEFKEFLHNLGWEIDAKKYRYSEN
ncbi:uncharacterized protein N7473_011666 [Penicillium subrubescens]|uniref:Uncharacterized protein n=1 Tax=Penicillium subrubescens TaxID=1316194 RepID=A0A1Q5TMG1_9EURO|nr:uncharacterized protein N7473_011666 [Penicillium subrubescens]KAJ5880613.1 hypothetical protein N7473_011666 [Penicillium subrubescens]OKP01411.1 hypothetical protein PENSUB_7401 [Penicillium subrubescens]